MEKNNKQARRQILASSGPCPRLTTPPTLRFGFSVVCALHSFYGYCHSGLTRIVQNRFDRSWTSQDNCSCWAGAFVLHLLPERVCDRLRNVLILLFTLMPLTLYAGDNAATFMEIGVGADAIGLGKSMVSYTQKSEALYWNPAGLAGAQNLDLSVMSTKAYETQYISVMSSSQFMGLGMGFGVLYSSMDGINETTLNDDLRGQLTGNSLGYSGTCFLVGTGISLSEQSRMGLTGKYILEKQAGYSGQGAALDLGYQHQITKDLGLGIQAVNALATGMKWDTPSGNVDQFSPIIYAGGHVQLFDDRMIIGYALELKKNRTGKHHVGISYQLIPLLAIRCGLDDEQLCIGTGLQIESLRMDISWSNPKLEQIDDIYRFSIGWGL